MREAIEEVAHQLGNTPAICRKSYVNPRVIDAYLDGALIPDIARMTAEPPRPGMGRLRSEEVATLAFLQDLERKARCAS